MEPAWPQSYGISLRPIKIQKRKRLGQPRQALELDEDN